VAVVTTAQPAPRPRGKADRRRPNATGKLFNLVFGALGRSARRIERLEAEVDDLRQVLNDVRAQLIDGDVVTWINAPRERDSYGP
jgi:hypothetical protein